MTWNPNFLRGLGKCLRNNAPPTILSNIPFWYPQISPTLLTLVCHPRHPSWHTAHFAHAGAPSRWHVILTCRPSNPRHHVTQAGTSPTLARLPCKHATHSTYASTNSMSFHKLLGIQFSFQGFYLSNSERKIGSFYF